MRGIRIADQNRKSFLLSWRSTLITPSVLMTPGVTRSPKRNTLSISYLCTCEMWATRDSQLAGETGRACKITTQYRIDQLLACHFAVGSSVCEKRTHVFHLSLTRVSRGVEGKGRITRESLDARLRQVSYECVSPDCRCSF